MIVYTTSTRGSREKETAMKRLVVRKFDRDWKKLLDRITSKLITATEQDIPANGAVSVQIDISRDERGVFWAKAWDGVDNNSEFFVVSTEHPE